MRIPRLCFFCLALGVSLPAAAAKEPDAVDVAIERGLEYLLASQKDDGSFHGQFGDTVKTLFDHVDGWITKRYL